MKKQLKSEIPWYAVFLFIPISLIGCTAVVVSCYSITYLLTYLGL